MTKILVKKLPRPDGQSSIKVNKTIQPVKKGNPANIEAQRGETVVGAFSHDGMPEMYMIGGKSHAEGGTDLNVPDNSFIFSKEKELRLTNPDILKMFGKKEKATGYDPAEISKQYDINNYRKILADPNSDKMQRDTAELMIKNYNEKLGALALTQESKKGFPDGIPFVSIPYLEMMGIDPATLVHGTGKDESEVPTDNEEDVSNKKLGGSIRIRVVKRPQIFQDGGSINSSSDGDNPTPPPEGGWMSKYNQLEQTYINSPKIQTAVYNQYKKDHPDTKLSEAQVNNYLITLQRHNYKLQNKFNDNPDELNTSDWDKGTASDRYKKEIKAVGENPLTPDQIKIAQGAYRGLVRLQNNPEHSDFFNQYGLKEFGPKKEKHQLDGRNVSMEDGLVGTNTVNQLLYPKDQVQGAVAAKEAEKQIAPLPELVKPQLKPAGKEKPTPFWTQDLVKMAGAAGDYARIKKYSPWQAGYQTTLPEAVYYDPTRELAANSEQSNIAEQSLGAFAGVQALSSRMSDVQGNALKNAADIMGRYNNLNVGIANNTEMNRVNIMNQDSQRRADRTTNLYDKNVIANQQFDNAKAMARQNMRQSFIDAWTNRGNTQALNSINKQYRVDSRTGYVEHTGVPGVVTPAQQNQGVLDYYNKLMEDPNIRSHPEHATELLKLYQKGLGMPGDTAIPYDSYHQ